MRVYKLTSKELAGCCMLDEKNVDTIIDELKNAQVGEGFEVEVLEMSQDEYDKLPEFEGW